MSVAEAAHRPAKSGRAMTLWLAFVLVIAAAVGLAWFGAASLRPQITASGLQFRTLKAGTGDYIGPADAALLDYILTADDGSVLDSSESHGGAQPFTMAQVFPGFAEAMARMQDGGEYRFTMPQKLAFGDKPAPQGFPKDSNLTFEVRVRKIVRGGAAMMTQGAPQEQGAPQGETPPPGETQPQQ